MRRFKVGVLVGVVAASAWGAELPAGRGRATVIRVCTKCHAAEVFAGKEHTREEWADILEEMKNEGARGKRAEFREILAYLEKAFPKRR